MSDIVVHFTATALKLIEARGLDFRVVSDWVIKDTIASFGEVDDDEPFKPEDLIIGSTPLTEGYDLFSPEGFWAVAGRPDGLHVDVGHWETFQPTEAFQEAFPGTTAGLKHLSPRQFESVEDLFASVFNQTEADDEPKQ